MTHKNLSLIELAVALALIISLAIIAVLAVNPAKQSALERNARRLSDINSIANAFSQYKNDHVGAEPASIPNSPAEICKDGVKDCGSLVDLSALRKDNVYLFFIPGDPQNSSEKGSGYYIRKNNNQLQVSAPGAELGQIITVSK